MPTAAANTVTAVAFIGFNFSIVPTSLNDAVTSYNRDATVTANPDGVASMIFATTRRRGQSEPKRRE